MVRLPRDYVLPRWGMLLIGLFWVGLIALFTYSGAQAVKRQRSAAQWAQDRATILSAEVGSSSYDGSIRYYPDVLYRYEVEELQYEGSNIYLTDGIVGYDDTFSREEQARSIIERFPVGAEVAVYYSPEHPEDSVLDRSQLLSSKRAFLLLGMLALFGVLTAWLIYFSNFSPVWSTLAVLLAVLVGLALAPSPGRVSELVGEPSMSRTESGSAFSPGSVGFSSLPGARDIRAPWTPTS